MSRKQKQFIIILFDIFALIAAIWIAFSLRLGVFYFPETNKELFLWLLAPVLAIPVFIRFGLYHAIIRYIGFQALWTVFYAVSLYILLWGVAVFLTGVPGYPRSVILINWLVCLLFIFGSRMLVRSWLTSFYKTNDKRKNVLIYGAGAAGVQLALALSHSYEMKPIAFVYDNISLQKHRINGLMVYSHDNLEKLILRFKIHEVLLAIPSVSRSAHRHILLKLESLSVHVRTLPGISELAQGRLKIDDIREVDIADLLGRDSVKPEKYLLSLHITNKTVMVTGAGGSIGSELCRQILALSPKRLILFEQSEYNLYAIEKELLGKNQSPVVAILGSVVDRNRVKLICRRFGVDTIYHAAAYKHVPMVETNPAVAVHNNIFGTLHTALAAIDTNVSTFVLISTDKAVRPTNVMGATKRFAELILQALSETEFNSTHKTCFTMVRFGNVLGSSGSVIPLFRQQIQENGVITVTHADIIRYFMTIPEAAQLVIQAGAMSQGGEVFVLDMGEAVRIYDLAKRMIRLSGLQIKDDTHPDGDIEIIITGLRPGEKLYEELLIGDNVIKTQHDRILKAEEYCLTWDQLELSLKGLNQAILVNDVQAIRSILLDVVKGYKPQCDIADVLFCE